MPEKITARRKLRVSWKQLFVTPERAFLTLALLFGLLYLIAIPPFQVPDEPGHFFRAYQLSNGQLIAEKNQAFALDAAGRKQYPVGGQLPLSVINTANIWTGRIPFRPAEKVKGEQFAQTFGMPLEREKTTFATFMSAIYSPVPYIPQIIGITVGKWLNLPPVAILYLGRLTNLIVTTGLVFFSIKLLSRYQWIFFLMALTPMALSQRASLSADAPLNSIAFVVIAAIANCAFSRQKEFVSNRDIALIAVFGALLSLSKQVYFLLPFLCFLIPVYKFGDRKRYWQSCLIIVLSTTLAWVAWGAALKGIGVPTNPLIDASVERQTQYLLTHPFSIFSTAWNSLETSEHVLTEFIGFLGWLDTRIPVITSVVYQHVLVFVALVNCPTDFVISAAKKWKILLVFAATVFLIYLSQYLIWTPVGASVVDGPQGRYFIPAAPLFFFLFYNHRVSFKISEKGFRMGLIYFSVFALLSSLVAVIARYY